MYAVTVEHQGYHTTTSYITLSQNLQYHDKYTISTHKKDLNIILNPMLETLKCRNNSCNDQLTFF